jgi:hypothetical protein
MLIGATALSVFPAPRASAQETLTIWYYQTGMYGSTRQPRTGTSGHFVKLAGPTTVGGALVPGATVPVQTVMPFSWNPLQAPGYTLAFVNITGGAEGGISVFPDSSGHLPLTVNVALPNTPNPKIAVNVYYFLGSGGGGGCPGHGNCLASATIDEFSDTQGMLLDDAFVSAFFPPATTPDSGLTTSGNVNGSVDTTKNAVRINADPTTPSGGSFDRWVSVPVGTISANDLNVDREKNVIAIVLYHSSCPDGYYWNPSAAVSQCVLVPGCPSGQAWNPTTKTCVPVTGSCPSTCIYGCYPPVTGPHGEPPDWKCKPQAGCNMHCPAGQYCSAVGNECSCIRCTPISVIPQPGNHPK